MIELKVARISKTGNALRELLEELGVSIGLGGTG